MKLLRVGFVVFLVAGLGAWVSSCSSSEPPSAQTGAETAQKAPPPLAPPSSETACDDGVDEDLDGKADCEDRDCTSSTPCQIARCKDVCAEMMACDLIAEACSDKEVAGVLAGCQASCDRDEGRGQVLQADGVPCFVIGGFFLERVQSEGLCREAEEPADGA